MKRLVVSIFFLSVISFQAANPAAESDLSEKIIASVNLMGLKPLAESANSDVRLFVIDVKDFLYNHAERDRVRLCRMNNIMVDAHKIYNENIHWNRVSGLAKLDNHTFASSLSGEKKVKVWTYDASRGSWVCTAKLPHRHRRLKEEISSLATLNDHTIIASDNGGFVKVYQRDGADHEWKWVANIRQNSDPVSSIVVLDDCTIALGLSGSRGGTVEIWSCANGIGKWQLTQTLSAAPVAETMLCFVNPRMFVVVFKSSGSMVTWLRNDIYSPWVYHRKDELGTVHIDRIKRINDTTFAAASSLCSVSLRCSWQDKWVIQRDIAYQYSLFASAPSMHNGLITSQTMLDDTTLVSGYARGDLEITKIPTLLEIALTIKLRGMNEAEKQEVYHELTAC